MRVRETPLFNRQTSFASMNTPGAFEYEKLSLVRALSGNPSYSEGWAHYDEQMMVDEGWGDGDPRVRLAQLALALQREARYLVGLREHTQGMTVDQGTEIPPIGVVRKLLLGADDDGQLL